MDKSGKSARVGSQSSAVGKPSGFNAPGGGRLWVQTRMPKARALGEGRLFLHGGPNQGQSHFVFAAAARSNLKRGADEDSYGKNRGRDGSLRERLLESLLWGYREAARSASASLECLRRVDFGGFGIDFLADSLGDSLGLPAFEKRQSTVARCPFWKIRCSFGPSTSTTCTFA